MKITALTVCRSILWSQNSSDTPKHRHGPRGSYRDVLNQDYCSGFLQGAASVAHACTEILWVGRPVDALNSVVCSSGLFLIRFCSAVGANCLHEEHAWSASMCKWESKVTSTFTLNIAFTRQWFQCCLKVHSSIFTDCTVLLITSRLDFMCKMKVLLM